ncbi:MAG TPA: helix-turn-helix domain-containing protein, partial [Desulfobacterales bacterium]|nr:helix-turn-helix domain-containing protein [Desulfobacterales bacterium]
MDEKTLLNTKEVARFLDVNEKVVYSLVAEKGLPATKVTGKWLFPRHLVERWIENNTLNYPKPLQAVPPMEGLLIIAGSNDIVLDQAISLFNARAEGQMAVFGNMGSMGGIKALRLGLCHMATSHLVEADGEEYNFQYLQQELDQLPAVVNFCYREQGLLIGRGNPKGIHSTEDLKAKGIRVVNRPKGTGTRLLFDSKLAEVGISPEQLDGYGRELFRHLDVGLEVLSGQADAGPGIKAVAQLLGLEFLSWQWERFDLLI